MKRFIALVLTLSMCLSVAAFLPMASAADAEPTVYEFKASKLTNIVLTKAPWFSTSDWEGFDFSDNLKDFYGKVTDGGITEWTFDNKVNNEFVKYTTADVFKGVTYDSLSNIKIRLAQMYTGYLYFAPSAKFTAKDGSTSLATIQANFKDAWIAVKLKAPTTRGTHELTLNWNSNAYVANGCDIFFAPYVEGQNDGDYYIANGEQLCTKTLFRYNANDASTHTSTLEKKVEIGDASHYILIFRLNGEGVTNRIALTSIALTKTKDKAAPEEAPAEVTYGVFDNIENYDAVTVSGGSDNKLFGAVEAGTEIKATAGEKDGYKFRYWVLGSVATGRYYSSEKTVTVKPYANVSLTAIYTATDAGKTYLDFFNYNGEFIDSKEVIDGKVSALPENPTLTGYSFTNWILEDKKTTFKTAAELTIPAGVTGAVAQYNALGGYDTPIENKGSENGWMRNGKLATYSADYVFYKWLTDAGIFEANTTESTEKTPIAILEKSGASFMLEYDKGAYEIKEAGILFGKTETVNVESAYSKAIAMRYEADGHGQLTATPNGDENMELYVRGYVMYGDKVIYTDAIAVK